MSGPEGPSRAAGKHTEPVVTYVIDRNIIFQCLRVWMPFLRVFRPPGHSESYVLSREELSAKIEETLRLGGTQVLLQGGHHPHLPLSFL